MGVDPNQDDPMVISVELVNFVVKKTLVDQGSSADILYYPTFRKLGIPKSEIKDFGNMLVGFTREHVETRGMWSCLPSWAMEPPLGQSR